MTCEDCIHNDVCTVLEKVADLDKGDANFCGCFNDKSNFVKLPCKIGDKVYWVDALNQIVEETVASFNIGIENEKGCYPLGHFGTSLFVTREEAEKKVRKAKK